MVREMKTEPREASCRDGQDGSLLEKVPIPVTRFWPSRAHPVSQRHRWPHVLFAPDVRSGWTQDGLLRWTPSSLRQETLLIGMLGGMSGLRWIPLSASAGALKVLECVQADRPTQRSTLAP